jgi:hypothetical protein
MLWNVKGHLEITFQKPPISTSTSGILVSGLPWWSTKQGNFVCIYLDLIAEFQTINHEMVNCVDVLRLFSYISRKHKKFTSKPSAAAGCGIRAHAECGPQLNWTWGPSPKSFPLISTSTCPGSQEK